MYSNITGLPSVTQVLSCFIDVSWFKAEHARRGNEIHAAMKSYLQGLWSPPVSNTDWQDYASSGKLWIDENVNKIIIVEKRFCDNVYGYTGQPDLIATLKNRQEAGVIDWKTAVAASITWKGQIAAYDHLCHINNIKTNWGCSVRLRQDGRIALADFMSRQELDVELQYFLNSLTGYRRYKLKEF